jgi:hypothetical protein
MPAAAWQEARLALAGTLRLALGDRGGLACFDRSLDGFWRSFRAALICFPLYLVLLHMRVSDAEWQRSGGWRIVTVETIGFVIGWVAFPLLMLRVTEWIGRRHRFFDFMVPYNWCQVPQTVLFLLFGLVFESGMLGFKAGEGIDMAAIVLTLLYEWYVWYIARVALDTTGAVAAFIALVDFILGVLVVSVSVSLY